MWTPAGTIVRRDRVFAGAAVPFLVTLYFQRHKKAVLRSAALAAERSWLTWQLERSNGAASSPESAIAFTACLAMFRATRQRSWLIRAHEAALATARQTYLWPAAVETASGHRGATALIGNYALLYSLTRQKALKKVAAALLQLNKKTCRSQLRTFRNRKWLPTECSRSQTAALAGLLDLREMTPPLYFALRGDLPAPE